MFTTIKRIALALPLVLLVWVGLMAGVMRVSDTAPAAVVLFPSQALVENLPEDTAILGLSPTGLTVQNAPHMTAKLYAAGAWLVLPAGLTGCVALTKAQTARLL